MRAGLPARPRLGHRVERQDQPVRIRQDDGRRVIADRGHGAVQRPRLAPARAGPHAPARQERGTKAAAADRTEHEGALAPGQCRAPRIPGRQPHAAQKHKLKVDDRRPLPRQGRSVRAVGSSQSPPR